jgi:hypothetical protein
VAVLAACMTEPPPPVARLTISPVTSTIGAGATLQLIAVPYDVSGNELRDRLVTWSTNAPAVATVSTLGLVAGVSPGPAKITATSEGKSATADIAVLPSVGPSGGTVTSADGNVVLVFPPGALSENLGIAIQPATAFPADPAVVNGTVYHLEPDGAQFAQPVQLTIKYAPTALPPGVEESLLKLYKAVGGAWQEIAGSTANPASKTVTGLITSFSIPGIQWQATPRPALTSLSPSSETTGMPDVTLRIEGSNFFASSKVRWNGDVRPTSFVDDKHLQATISASDLATARSVPVTVFNPSPEGDQTSGALQFCVGQHPTGSTFAWPVDCHAVSVNGYAKYGRVVAKAYHTGLDISQTTTDGYNYTTAVRAVWPGIITKIFGLGNIAKPLIINNLRRWDRTTDAYWWEAAPTRGPNHGLGISVIIYHPDLQLYTLYGHLDAVIEGLARDQQVLAGQIIGRMGNSYQEYLRRCPTEKTDDCPPVSDADAPPGIVPDKDADGFKPHVHFEVKDRGVLSAQRTDDGPLDWGYTRCGADPTAKDGICPDPSTPNMPGHPNWFGYHNPAAFLDQAVQAFPEPVAVQAFPALTFPVFVLDYPGYPGPSERPSLKIAEIKVRDDGRLPAFVAKRRIGTQWYEIYLPNADEVRQPTVREGWSASGWIAGSFSGVEYSRINAELPQVIITQDSARVRGAASDGGTTLVFAYGKIAPGKLVGNQFVADAVTPDSQRFVPFDQAAGWYRVYLPDKSSQADGWISADDARLEGSLTPTPPDLTVSAGVASSYQSGQANVAIPVTVFRTGGTLTLGTYVTARLYWSSDPVWNASDLLLWESNGSLPDFPNSTLNSRGSNTVTATVNLPAQPAGPYYILAVVDPDNFHPESDENNNLTPFQTTLTPPPGDLRPVTGRVIDGSTGAPIAGATLRFLSAGSEVSRVTTDADGRFQAALTEGTYDVVAEAQGYVAVTLFDARVTAQGAVLETIPLVPNSPFPGAISGSIRNARTGLAIPGATVELRPGMNALSGTPTATTTADGGGQYRFDALSANTYTVVARASGYTNGFRTGIVVGGREVPGQDVALSPSGALTEVRIVLTWGAEPSDLDSHLTGPTETGGRFHIYFASQGSLTGPPWAALDVDDITSYGPETITIVQQLVGVYRYSVHDFSNRFNSYSVALANSGARVDLYRGASLIQSFFPPSTDGTLWTVFELEGDQVRPVNRMSYESTPGAITAAAFASARGDDGAVIRDAVAAHPKNR